MGPAQELLPSLPQGREDKWCWKTDKWKKKKKKPTKTRISLCLGCLENSDQLGGWREVKHPPGSRVR